MDQLLSEIAECTAKGWCVASDPNDPNNPEKMVYHVPKPFQSAKVPMQVEKNEPTVPAGYAGPMPGSAECLPVHCVSGVGDGVGGLDDCM